MGGLGGGLRRAANSYCTVGRAIFSIQRRNPRGGGMNRCQQKDETRSSGCEPGSPDPATSSASKGTPGSSGGNRACKVIVQETTFDRHFNIGLLTRPKCSGLD